eukprot:gnl/MRDRNA2_/MRDRNA2_92313_c0_seq1.p1 gnl/MRDRNA2_/MRDRNA2_92313_c0~~gnl/MRDRNA2_/MRDRNA2_92313_c0_seq1.p1  ORF type:complete len:298 (+),score=88.07 gnl/MRDRNA2_/MRDRNA2_92313_c0_seq1:69-896(+)
MATGKCIALVMMMLVSAEKLDFEDAVSQMQIPNSRLRANLDFTQQGSGVEQYYARLPMPTDAPSQHLQQQVVPQQVLSQQQQLQLQKLLLAQQQQIPAQAQVQAQGQVQAQLQQLQKQQQLQQGQQIRQRQQIQQQQAAAQNLKPAVSQGQGTAQSLAASKAAPQAPDVSSQVARIAPFGKEDTAAELQNHAAKTQDTLVDAVENAEVAEIKRAVFRALTRLRAASIKEFDTIARLETQAIDEYNDAHHYRAENPLSYIHSDEPKVTEDKFTSFH